MPLGFSSQASKSSSFHGAGSCFRIAFRVLVVANGRAGRLTAAPGSSDTPGVSTFHRSFGAEPAGRHVPPRAAVLFVRAAWR